MSARLSSLLLLAATLAVTGCVGVTVRPEKPASMPHAQGAPLPLRVGVVLKSSVEWHGMGMSDASMARMRRWHHMHKIFDAADNAGQRFVTALQESGAFASADLLPSASYGRLELESHDLIVDAQIKTSYTQDPATMPKAFLTGFLLLLPSPFITVDDTFTGSGDVSIYDSTGRLVKRLSEKQDVTTESKVFSAGLPSQLASGIDSAAYNLADKLVRSILDSREELSAAAKGARGLARRSAPEPDPEVAKAVAEAEKAAAAAAAAEARVAALKAAHGEAPATAAPSAEPAPPSADTPASAEASTAATQPDLAEGPSRISVPGHAKKIRITDAEAAAELLP